ncbi:hypothetical protein GMOD_00004609 [Pyrenophora seminiperda CCB06]|uniref:Uncharacterized protein n=1 Tax=Pyrenophora seminiperda CCB06 TaxID=1302712 RepID=A0A3M7MH37_9PLEO|nr:hypothetical protein GMOD_00004609 [Pyrenophora seminiperda CCB06]
MGRSTLAVGRSILARSSDQFTGGGHGSPVLLIRFGRWAALLRCANTRSSLAGLDAEQDCNDAHSSSD